MLSGSELLLDIKSFSKKILFQVANQSQIDIDLLLLSTNFEDLTDTFYITNKLQDSDLILYSEKTLSICQQIPSMKQNMTCYQVVNRFQTGIDLFFFLANFEDLADIFYVTDRSRDYDLRLYLKKTLFIYQEISNMKQYMTCYQVVNYFQTHIDLLFFLSNLGNYQNFINLLAILGIKQNIICYQVANRFQTDIDLLLQIADMKKNIHLHKVANYSLTPNLFQERPYPPDIDLFLNY